MKYNALPVAVMLSTYGASGIAENVATTVNIISGITADEEYCLSAQGGDTMESVRVGGGRAHVRSLCEFRNLDFPSIAHVGDVKQYNLEEKERLASHLIVFSFVVLCVVSILDLKFISGVMHWRQVVSA